MQDHIEVHDVEFVRGLCEPLPGLTLLAAADLTGLPQVDAENHGCDEEQQACVAVEREDADHQHADDIAGDQAEDSHVPVGAECLPDTRACGQHHDRRDERLVDDPHRRRSQGQGAEVQGRPVGLRMLPHRDEDQARRGRHQYLFGHSEDRLLESGAGEQPGRGDRDARTDDDPGCRYDRQADEHPDLGPRDAASVRADADVPRGATAEGDRRHQLEQQKDRGRLGVRGPHPGDRPRDGDTSQNDDETDQQPEPPFSHVVMGTWFAGHIPSAASGRHEPTRNQRIAVGDSVHVSLFVSSSQIHAWRSPSQYLEACPGINRSRENLTARVRSRWRTRYDSFSDLGTDFSLFAQYKLELRYCITERLSGRNGTL